VLKRALQNTFLLPISFGIASLLGAATTTSAAVCDLTTYGSSCGPALFGGAIYQHMTVQPTGTGVIDPFLRLQATRTEQGYNTSDRSYPTPEKMQFDQKEPLNYTHDLQTSAVPIVNIDGVSYRQFALDVNEPSGGKGALISLDQLQIFQSNTASLNSYNTGTRTLSGATLKYDLDTGTDNWIKLDYSLNSGSGSGDMFAYIPASLFDPAAQYVYLFSQFGTNWKSADGFEEWWVLKGPSNQQVPEPATVALFGIGLFLVAARLRRTAKLNRPGK